MGGNAASEEFFKSVDSMWGCNVQSAVTSAHIASKYLQENGLLVFTGSAAALTPTPGMIGYGLAKAAVHHLVASLASPGSGLPKGTTVIGLLPVTLDTESNRAGMPDADRSTWTPLEEVSKLLTNWYLQPSSRPPTGSLIQLNTSNFRTSTTKCWCFL